MKNSVITDDVLNRIEAVLSASGLSKPWNLHEPSLGIEEEKKVLDCIRSGWISTAGPAITEFESKISALTQSPHTICVINGTSALHAAFMALEIGENDEVWMPALSFAAPANAVMYCGAKPYFLDSETKSFGLDVEKLQQEFQDKAEFVGGVWRNKVSGRTIRAVLSVHIFGHMCEIDRLRKFCDEHDLWLIEDAAEALGSTYKGRAAGTFGHVGILSFNGNKIITTGSGGAVLTADAKIADRVRHLTTTAKITHPFETMHDEVGYNYRMSNLNASLGLAQIEKINLLISSKRNLFRAYQQSFETCEFASVLQEPAHCVSNYWLNTIILSDEIRSVRTQLLEILQKNKIFARAIWKPLHFLNAFLALPHATLPATESIYELSINVPSAAFFGADS